MSEFTETEAEKVWKKVFDTLDCPKCGTRIKNVSAKLKKSFRTRAFPRRRRVQCKHCHYKIELEVSESGEILNYS